MRPWPARIPPPPSAAAKKKTLETISRPLKIGDLLWYQSCQISLSFYFQGKHDLYNPGWGSSWAPCSAAIGQQMDNLSFAPPSLHNCPRCGGEWSNMPTQSLLIQMACKSGFSVHLLKIIWLLSESHQQRYSSLWIWLLHTPQLPAQWLFICKRHQHHDVGSWRIKLAGFLSVVTIILTCMDPVECMKHALCLFEWLCAFSMSDYPWCPLKML